MPSKKIRVLVVDDSMFIREYISQELSKDDSIEVVATASNPFEARDKIIEFAPDVMTLDIEMPRMNGIDFLKRLMPQYPLPVVVVSSLNSNVFDALNAGAVDFVNKADFYNTTSKKLFSSELIVKIKIASIAKVGQHKTAASRMDENVEARRKNIDSLVIAMGASTGGTEAIYSVLKELKNDLPGIVVVQHMPPGFTKMYAERLNNTCMFQVKEAEDGDLVLPGRVLIAAGEYHLRLVKVGSGYKVQSKRGDRVNGHCPSVDVLFESVAQAAKSNALGIIFTGMGGDGAEGLLKMRQQGAATIGQNAESCVVYGMPAVAHQIGAVQKQASLNAIPGEINRWFHDKVS